jgi:hypothetical protein
MQEYLDPIVCEAIMQDLEASGERDTLENYRQLYVWDVQKQMEIEQ